MYRSEAKKARLKLRTSLSVWPPAQGRERQTPELIGRVRPLLWTTGRSGASAPRSLGWFFIRRAPGRFAQTDINHGPTLRSSKAAGRKIGETLRCPEDVKQTIDNIAKKATLAGKHKIRRTSRDFYGLKFYKAEGWFKWDGTSCILSLLQSKNSAFTRRITESKTLSPVAEISDDS